MPLKASVIVNQGWKSQIKMMKHTMTTLDACFIFGPCVSVLYEYFGTIVKEVVIRGSRFVSLYPTPLIKNESLIIGI